MDDSKLTLGDDEFHFSEAEEATSDPYSLSGKGTEPKASKFSRRNVLIAIGVIVVALSVYKLIGIFFGASSVKKNDTIATTAQVKPAKKPITQNSTANLNNIVSQPQTPMVQIQSQTEQNKKLQSRLTEMQQTDVVHNQQMRQVSDQVSSLADTVRSLSQSVDSMNQSLANISSELQSQQMSIAALKAKTKKRIVRRTSYIYKRPIPKWYVQAIIPGRAWLQQSNGQTTTVSKGDILKGYGKVRTISVINGTVKLSSGAILTFRDS